MARERTKEEIVDEVVFAAAIIATYYGPGFSQEGLTHLRAVISTLPWSCDATWLTDVDEEGEGSDFHKTILGSWVWGPRFEEVVEDSKVLELDPIEQFAIAILSGDPIARDAARDVLTRGG